MIQRLVKLQFHAENCTEFEAIFRASRPKILATPGCLHLECWRNANEPTVYYTYSRWSDEDALNAYRHSDFFLGTWSRTKALFRGRPEAISAHRLSELRPPAPDVKRLEVDDYYIEIGPIQAQHFSWLHEKQYAGWVVIVDEMTREYCLPRLLPFLDHERTVIIEVPPGELHKHLDTTRYIWEEMFRAGVGRRWCVLNLGGGVIGDMGGFAARTFKRGVDFVQIPTTLLSQVDASVGGKLGIDFFEVKNSIGVFANPQSVWIDPVFLDTLSDRELRSGYAEVVKHALIASPEQWEEMKHWRDLRSIDWQQVIPASVSIKRDVVEMDPHEKGWRKALNFGHTIGHAIESHWLPTDNRLLHGEAIAAGMIMEAWLSHQLDELQEDELADIAHHLIELYGHQPIPEAIFPKLVQLMRQDKKNEDGNINFTFLRSAGAAKVNGTADQELIESAMRYYNTLG